MPNNILKDFFYGNINPNEKQFDCNSEYGKAAAGLADEEEKLRSMLDHETSEILDKMICLQASITGMTAEEYFIDGLRTGFRLALAILDEGKTALSRQLRMVEKAVNYTISSRHLCVVYYRKWPCYYPLLERICVHRKGKHTKRKRRISE